MHNKLLVIVLAGTSLFLCGAGTERAHAEFIASIDQVDSSVVVSGSGTLDLTDLTFQGG